MISIRQILNKVFPKLQALEENPELTIIRISTTATSNPFETESSEVYDESVTVPVIYSEQPEIVTNANNISTQQSLYFYVQVESVPFVLTVRERFIFKNKRYRPVEVQDLFGLWKIKVVKE